MRSVAFHSNAKCSCCCCCVFFVVVVVFFVVFCLFFVFFGGEGGLFCFLFILGGEGSCYHASGFPVNCNEEFLYIPVITECFSSVNL